MFTEYETAIETEILDMSFDREAAGFDTREGAEILAARLNEAGEWATVEYARPGVWCVWMPERCAFWCPWPNVPFTLSAGMALTVRFHHSIIAHNAVWGAWPPFGGQS